MSPRDIPAGLRIRFHALGATNDEIPALLEQMAALGDEYAAHFRCGFLHGILGSLMCREGHRYPAEAVELSNADVRRLIAETRGEAEVQSA